MEISTLFREASPASLGCWCAVPHVLQGSLPAPSTTWAWCSPGIPQPHIPQAWVAELWGRPLPGLRDRQSGGSGPCCSPRLPAPGPAGAQQYL